MRFANKKMIDESSGKSPTDLAADETNARAAETGFDSQLPAGYTYFGQFVDHDITLDVTSLSESEIDPDKLINFRTPRLDLDNVYGQGPDEQPYLYEHEAGKFTGRMLLGNDVSGADNDGGEIKKSSFPDLPRNAEGRALIGDMRNDENAIVAQYQLAFIRAHNKLIDKLKLQDPSRNGKELFVIARKSLIWLYQWVVWNDFVKRVTDPNVHANVLQKSTGKGCLYPSWELGKPKLFEWKKQPFMPVEFSVAAYRFGHTLVRNSYQTHAGASAGFLNFTPIFDVGATTQNDLRGFGPLTRRRVLQWDWFLKMKSSIAAGGFPQRARKFDPTLSMALTRMIEDRNNVGAIENVLAARNLVRGVRMGLPSGIDVAVALGETPVKLSPDEPETLWYYILKEAKEKANGESLGRVGSLIVCSVFAGLLKGDPLSWINQAPNWTPDKDPVLNLLKSDPVDPIDPTIDSGKWELSSIIRISGLPVDRQDINNLGL